MLTICHSQVFGSLHMNKNCLLFICRRYWLLLPRLMYQEYIFVSGSNNGIKGLLTSENMRYLLMRPFVICNRNSHLWDNENRHAIHTRRYQHKFVVKFGRYCWKQNNRSLLCLIGDIREVFSMDLLPVFVRQRRWYQCDVSPAVKYMSDIVFMKHIPIWHCSLACTLPRCDSFRFRSMANIKLFVYTTPVESEDLLAQILVKTIQL